MSYANVKGVIFDLGSTLIEYENLTWDKLALEGQRLGYKHLADNDHRLPDFAAFNSRLEEIKNEFRIVARDTLKEWRAVDAAAKLFDELGLENPHRQARRFMDISWDVVRRQATLCEGAVAVLKNIKDQGYRTGMISNTIFSRHNHETDLEMFGIIPYIDFRIYSSEIGWRKPHPNIFAEGLKRIELPPEATIYVGDRIAEDVQGPLSMGMKGILKRREGRDYPDPMPDGFPVIKKLSELTGILKQ